MSKINELFKSEVKVLNMGLESFKENLQEVGVETAQINWRPPAGGDPELLALLNKAEEFSEKINKANKEVVDKIINAKPCIVGIGKALDTIPGMEEDMILHSGPPVAWDRMSGPTRGAVIGALIYEEKAKTVEEAEKLAASGKVKFSPCHEHLTVGPMAGIVSASMPVWIIENKSYGNKAYCTFNEVLGKVLMYGAYGEEVNKRLKWLEAVLSPVMKKVIEYKKEIDLKNIISLTLHMGDECHNRNRASTTMFLRQIMTAILEIDVPLKDKLDVVNFIDGNEHFFLNLSMPAMKATVDPGSNTKNSSIVLALARNGTDFGIRVAGCGDKWFIGPAGIVDGLYLPGYKEEDAAPDIGDSTITETGGIGGFAMAAAPAIVQFVGGTADMALNFTMEMYEITETENNTYTIPALNFKGTPTGINLLKIIEKDILPAINTGIAHKTPGVGMVGAGLVKPPKECFVKAFKYFVNNLS